MQQIYEGYFITSCGKVWSYKRNRFLNPALNKRGYLQVRLYKNGKAKTYTVHQLVANVYLSNPNSYNSVDHIDENKLNNCINNLQWMDKIENKRKSWQKPVRCIETGDVYESQTKAAEAMGHNKSNLNAHLHGKAKTFAGYHWEVI